MIFLVSRREILELDSPFGCGDSPLFTYPFFGEEQIVTLPIPPGTPERTLESLEIVFCICSELMKVAGATVTCYLGSNDERILRDARKKIQDKLIEMAEASGFKIKFHHSWKDFQTHFIENIEQDPNLMELESDKNVKVLINESRGDFYNHFQLLLPFFIEAATPIDTTDPKWSIYLQFQDSNLTGLLTAYNYFRFPEGTRVRISQVLVLPRYQGRRLGSQLYRSVTESLRQSGSECVEICVEDPTDAFERIRGLIDYQECLARGIFNDQDGDDKLIVDEMIKVLKLNPEHAERLLLLNKSIKLPVNPTKRPKPSHNHTQTQTLLRQQIKRWLLKKFRKNLPENSSDRIERLAELYESEMDEFIEPLIEILKMTE